MHVHQLQAMALTLEDLVERVVESVPREQRRKVGHQVLNEILGKVWRGIPGQSRVPGQPPTPIDRAALEVLDVVLTHGPRRRPRPA